ncbi:RDD family protein [Streptomyces tropicalis]|uniref:RDD family protein n=1 Tax=Streptomyces tropicalis TaxID=3034234 RepID=A0ABT6A4X1_9ACTN|nr:RDD family protein [Streptomyces tropicalis]MDF3299508.1 RDD family protein [Streptomyces tropicalis]
MTAVTRAHGPAEPGLQGLPAGIVSRAVAAAVDALVVTALVLAIDLGIGAVAYLLLGPPFSPPDAGAWITFGWGAVVAVGYLAGNWAVSGRTVGDQLMGLRVTRRSGGRLRPGAATVRAVLWIAAPWGLLWVPVSRRRASVQDLVVGSCVVHDWYGRSRPPGHHGHR